MSQITIALKGIAAQLRAMFPGEHIVELTIQGDEPPKLTLNGSFSYQEGLALLRPHLEGEWEKEIYGDAGFRWTKVKAVVDGVRLEALCNGLPPSCRLVPVVKRIPKTATVDTGEFIEVTEQKVVCGNGEPA